MSETDFLKLKKHDNPETNTEKFDIENYLNGNWDKINENAKEVNTNISNINSKDTELEKELKEAQEDFYQNSIRGQASGEYIHVEDSSNCRSIIGISGNSEQETRSGKNKIDLAKCQIKTSNGVTSRYNKENNSITFNGTCTGDNTVFYIFENWENVDDNNVLIKNNSTLLAQYVSGNVTGRSRFRLSDKNWQDKIGLDLTILNSTNKKIYNTYSESDTTIKYLSFRFEKGTVLNNFTIQLMLTDTVDTEYEMYGASPSRDYPSEVESVGSNINILPSNLFSSTALNGINYTNKDGIITVNGTATENSFYTKTITLKAGTYTLNGAPKGSAQDRYCLQAQGLGAGDFGSGQTFTIDTEKQVTLRIMVWKGITVNNIIFKPKLINGTVATPYSKYGQGCVKVTKCNKNLFPLLKSQSKENKGIIFSYNAETQEFSAKGTTTDTSFYTTVTFEELKYLSKDKKYILSISNLTPKKCMVALTKINVINNGIINEGKKQTTVDNLDKYKPDGFMFYGQNFEKGTKIDFTFKAQIEEGLTETSLTQHEEQSYIMPVQQEMLVNDYLDYDNEEEVHVWNKKVLDGTEEINLQWDASDKHGYRIVINDIKKTTSSADKSLIISNSYKAYIQDDLFNLKYKAHGISNRYNNSEVIIRNDDITTVTDFKAYLKSQYDAGTPVVVYYQLATPTRLKFTDEQKAVAKELNNARTYKNVTNITTDSKAILSLDYAKDLETLLNNTQALAVNNASEGV